MGFKREKTVYKLVWPEEHENHGLEVGMRSMSTEELLKVGGMADLDLSGDAGPEAMAALDEMLGLFASKLVYWNLEDEDDQPVPATYEGVRGQDLDFILELVNAWMTYVAGVALPLGPRSVGGGRPPAGSIPMEPLSTSRAS